MKNRFSFSFFNKLLIISCVIGIFPILLLGYLSYHKSSSALIDELNDSKKLILQQNKASVEAMLKTVDTLTTQTINTPVTTNAMSMQSVLDLPFEHRYRDIFNKLTNSLVQIQVYELGITDVKLVSYVQNWIIDSGAVYPMKNRIRVDSHDDYLNQTYQDLLNAGATGATSYWELKLTGDETYMLRLNKHVPINSVRPYGIISVYIPLTEVSKQLSGNSSSGNTFVVTQDGKIISSLVSEDIGSNIFEQDYFKDIQAMEQREGYLFHSIQKEKLLIHFNKSLYNNWIYISVTPYKDLIAKTNSIKLYTTISASILILLVITISYFFSNKLSSPIVRLYRSISSHKKPTGHNELGYISEHLNELTLSKHQLNAKVNQLHKQAQEFFVIKLFSGQLNVSSIQEELERLSLPINWEVWCVVSLQIEPNEQKYSSQDYELLLFAISNIIDETIDKTRILPAVTNNHMLHIFVGQAMESTIPLKIYAYNTMLKLQEDIQKYLKLSINVGISREYRDWRYAPLATDESVQALYYRKRLEEAAILYIDEVEPAQLDAFRYPKEIENQLIEAIKMADADQAYEQLNELLQNIEAYATHHSDYQHAFNRLINNLTGIVHDSGGTISNVLDVLRLSSFPLENSNSYEEKKLWLVENIIQPLIEWNRERIQKTEINISQFIIQHIKEYYDQDLSIEYFAGQLNYHPSYISRVFKKDTGITFSDYLSNYRIDQAKYMLRHTDMRIADIAEKLRYSTPSNFNRQFKKVVQLTPSQYREKQE